MNFHSSHIFRKGNRVADTLTNDGIKSLDLYDLDTCFVSRKDDDDDDEVDDEEEDDDDGHNKLIYNCNIHTGECSKTKMYKPFYGRALQIKLPWWPTPAPTIRSCKSRDLSEQVIQ
ncbi:hypothetical protein ACLB2K_048761 [Fragaria x ananassa]